MTLLFTTSFQSALISVVRREAVDIFFSSTLDTSQVSWIMKVSSVSAVSDPFFNITIANCVLSESHSAPIIQII